MATPSARRTPAKSHRTSRSAATRKPTCCSCTDVCRSTPGCRPAGWSSRETASWRLVSASGSGVSDRSVLPSTPNALDQVADDDHVQRDHDELRRRQAPYELVNLERDERGGQDDREVFRP